MAGCSTDAGSTDTELYTRVLSAAREELGLPNRVAIHPLPALWPEDDRVDMPLTQLNAYDTTSIPGIISANPAAYHLCELNAAGMCQVSAIEVAVVLSSFRALKTKDLVLRLVIYDGRSKSDYYKEYFARLNHGWFGGWDVVDFKRLN